MASSGMADPVAFPAAPAAPTESSPNWVGTTFLRCSLPPKNSTKSFRQLLTTKRKVALF